MSVDASSTVTASRRGMRGFLATHPVFVDATVAAAYVLVLLPGLVHGLIFPADGSAVQAGGGLAATLGAGVALAFRRRAPILVLAAVFMLVLVVKTLWCDLTDPLGLAIAGYAVGAYLSPRRAWIAAAAATIGIVAVISIGAPLSPGAPAADALLILNLVLFVPACLIGLLTGTRSRLRESEELRGIQQVQEQVRAAELSAMQERTVLSREMHDVVGHSLTAIINLSDGALRASNANPDLLEAGLRRINDIARGALGETRTILGTLRTEDEPPPRTPARTIETVRNDAALGIHDLLATAESTGLTTRLLVDGEPDPETLTDEVASAVYRIVQEAVTNVMRHATKATLLTVSLSHTPQGLTVQVHDNGQHPVETSLPGNGLTGAAERAVLLGGELHSGPAPAGGWHVTLTIPARTEAAR